MARKTVTENVAEFEMETVIDPREAIVKTLNTMQAADVLRYVATLCNDAGFGLKQLGGARAIGNAIAEAIGPEKMTRVGKTAQSAAQFIESIMDGGISLSRANSELLENKFSTFCVVLFEGRPYAANSSVAGAIRVGVSPTTLQGEAHPIAARVEQVKSTKGKPASVLRPL